MKRIGLIIVIGLLILAMVGCSKFVSVRNELATEREQIRGAYSAVEVVLQRRADLIPNLVNTVAGFAKQEKEVLTNIANARAALVGARTPQEKFDANNRLDSALGRLLVVVENYPQLKSNENFLRLQDELSGTENRISIERRKYNETVQRYNTTLSLFPNNLVANMSGFQREDAYFSANPESRNAPKVQFP